MQQYRTRPTGHRARRTAPLPPQAQGRGSGTGAGAGSASVYRAGAHSPKPMPPAALALRRTVLVGRRVALAVRRMPNPRLTGLGGGLFCAVSMLAAAGLAWLLFDSPGVAYGVLFLPVSALTALWVRPADLVTAPVAVPIAFAVGLVPIAEGTEGFGGQLMGLVTSLAVHAGWLYGGTLVAGVIVTVRKVRIMVRRRAMRSAARSPHRRMPA